ncbi:sapecin [Fopius arisanus]|uniref:Sapecin n=1 Tax=Fopius arisanus TaxID=64838 RepID=A0A9R1TAK6_9HYME|nr:PREDICTED: sapecin-like [Fopius arisanus]
MKYFFGFFLAASIAAGGFAASASENETPDFEVRGTMDWYGTTVEIKGTIPPSTEATPVQLADVDSGLKTNPEEILIRSRRLTCDFFSFSSAHVTPNHAACAAKCMGMGRKGGSCQGMNCVCRDDKWVGR